TRFSRDWSSDVCSSDLYGYEKGYCRFCCSWSKKREVSFADIKSKAENQADGEVSGPDFTAISCQKSHNEQRYPQDKSPKPEGDQYINRVNPSAKGKVQGNCYQIAANKAGADVREPLKRRLGQVFFVGRHYFQINSKNKPKERDAAITQVGMYCGGESNTMQLAMVIRMTVKPKIPDANP